MKHKGKLLLLAVTALAGICFLPGKTSSAKSEIVSLNVNRPYVNYDVNNDGKKDRIEVLSKDKGDINILRIRLNNKIIYKHKEAEGYAEVSLIRMKKKRTLLYVAHLGVDDIGPREIYMFRGAKWKRLINLNPTKEEKVYDTYRGSPDGVSSTTVTIRYEDLNYMVGATEYVLTYSFSDDRLIPPVSPVDVYIMKQGSSAYKKNVHLIAKQEMPVYVTTEISTETPEASQIATIRPGDDVIVRQFIRVDSKPWFQVSIGDVTGWIPSMELITDEDGSGHWFADIMMYG